MKRLIALFTALILLFAAACGAENADLSALQAENAALRAEVERLNARLQLYADPAVIAVFDGGCVTYDDIREDYEMYLSFYSLFGLDITASPDDLASLQLSLIDACVEKQLVAAWVAREGVTLLTAEAEAAALAEADAAYDTALRETLAYFTEETPEDALTLAEAMLSEIGSSREDIRQAYLQDARDAAAIRLITADVTLSEEEAQAFYAEHLESDRDYYSTFPGEYAWNEQYELILWVPEGYRQARTLLIPFSEEQQAAYDDLLYQAYESESAEEWLAITQKMDEIHARLLPEAQAALARIEAGESFDALVSAYSTLSETLLVSADSWDFDTDALMNLAAPGDVTAPVPCDSGFMIVQFVAPVPAGAVPYEDVRNAIRSLALDDKCAAAYAETLAQWKTDAHVEYLTLRLNG